MKNCIFITVFGQDKFVDMFLIQLESILLSGSLDNDNTEILLYIDPRFVDIIKASDLYDDNKMKIVTADNKNSPNGRILIKNACEARLDLFDLPIDQYDKILYLDTDTIIKSSLQAIFDVCVEDKLYCVREDGGDITMQHVGGTLFGDEVHNYEDKSAFTSGIMLMNNVDMFRNLFDIIKQDIIDRPFEFDCYDQPYIVYHTFKNVPYDNKTMYSMILNSAGRGRHHVGKDVEEYVNREEIIFHFCGGPGSWDHKIDNMTIMLDKLKSDKDNYTPSI